MVDRVGFIGLGRMGGPMAANLARAGFPLTVHNRSAAVADAFGAEHGVAVARDPADLAARSDVVITMGCGDKCPFYPGTRYLDWALDDPAGQGADAVRPIRDQIDVLVQELLRELLSEKED